MATRLVRAWIALVLLSCAALASAQTRFEYAAPAYQEVAAYVRDAGSPGEACQIYASIFGWNTNNYSAQANGILPGYWACQRYYKGAIDPSNVTYITGQCQLHATPLVTLTGRQVSAPEWDKNTGTCFCTYPAIFDAQIQWCDVKPVIYTIAIAGATRTKALVAGPALAQTVTVSASRGSAANIPIAISITNGQSINATTDASGSFTFTYVPPYRPTVDRIIATCAGCSNTAGQDITVDACDVCQGTVGNPIQPATGEKQQSEVDWVDESPHPLTVTRTYRSFGAAPAGLGAGWTLPWSARAVIKDDDAIVYTGDGRRVNFRRGADGAPWRSIASTETLVPVAGGFDYVNPSSGVTHSFDISGLLLRITQRNGWTMTVRRDAPGNVASVTNAFGRSLLLSYDSGLLRSITTPDGVRIAYGIDAQGRLAGVSAPDGTSRGYLYEAPSYPGLLTGIVDERGVRLATFAYDANGRAVSTQHAGTQSFGVAYGQSGEARGRLVASAAVDPGIYRTTATVSDPLGTPRTYEWVGGDGHVRMSGASLAGGISGVASRGAESLPSYETDFSGVTTTFAWDWARRLKAQTTQAAGRPESRTTSTDWHPVFDLPVRLTEPGRVTEYAYDPFGNKVSETVADTSSGHARTTQWSYAQGLVTSMTDARGGVWKYGYDAAGNRTSETDPVGAKTIYTYDAAGRVTSRTDPGGLVTTYARDARGRLTSQSVGGETTSFAYSATGQLAAVALPNGYQVTYAYDAADRLVGASDNRGSSVAYTLDGAGNRVREEVKDANGNIALAMTRSIDALNRVAATQGAVGQTTQYGYDANGEPVSTTDPLNQTTRQTLDALRRTTATTFPDNASVSQEWNALDAQTQVTDPKGVKTQYETDAFGDVTRETSADAGAKAYERDSAGNVIATTDANGNVARITRDALGRVTEVKYADQTQVFAYDAQGDVRRIDDGSGSTVYARDPQGRVVTKTQTVLDIPSSPSKYVVQYGYAGGDLASIKYPSGLLVTYRRTAGRVTQVDVQAPANSSGKAKPAVALVSALSYSALGQPKAWTWFNGDSASRSFDGDGRMTANEVASYSYDAASRITGITQNLWVNSGTQLTQVPISWTVGYDSRNRLTSMARNGHSAAFTYDANSNRLSRMEIATGEVDLEGQFDAPGFSLTTGETPRIDATSNRLLGFSILATATSGTQSSTSSSDVAYVLDANGNMTSDGLRTFTYDASNRLARVQAIKNGDAVGVEYLHNAWGQRVFKSDPLAESTVSLDGKFSSGFIGWLKSNFGWMFSPGQAGKARTGLAFVYDESANLLASYGNGSNQASQQQMEFIWLPLEDGRAIPVGIYKSGQLYAVHTDHLRTPRLVTDAAKAPVWQWPYSAFGSNKPMGVLNTISTATAAGTTTQLKATAPGFDMNLRYPGQYWDSESNLSQNWNREYSARLGRYVQSDPLGMAGGINRYGYVSANPLSLTDPSGTAPDVRICVNGVCTPPPVLNPDDPTQAPNSSPNWLDPSQLLPTWNWDGITWPSWLLSSGNEDATVDAPVPPFPGIKDLAKDCVAGKRLVSTITTGRHKGRTNIEQEYQCSCGTVTRHTIVKPSGKIVHDHFRPGPAKGTDGD